MNITWKTITRNLSLVALCSLAAACVAVVPVPSGSGNKADNDNTSNTAPSAVLCNVEGKQEQDLSDGTTKAKIIHSCQETIVHIENKNTDYPKRCKVQIGDKSTELYIKPGESRSYTQTGPVARTSIKLDCVNDWNKPK